VVLRQTLMQHRHTLPEIEAHCREKAQPLRINCREKTCLQSSACSWGWKNKLTSLPRAPRVCSDWNNHLMTKPFLIIQLRPENVTADSELSAIMRYGQLRAADMVRLRAEHSGLTGIDLDQFCGIIVGGSPFDISTPESNKSTLQRQIEAGFMRLLEQVTRRDFPFLGCCSGNGLLAKFCGSPISGRYAESVGGVDITLTAAARLDPLLHDLPTSIRVMVGHKEACDAPPVEATLLATASSCPVQMFRLQQNIYATQFHPEGDAQEFITRIKTYRHNGYFDPGQADVLIRRVSREYTPWSHEILRRFVQRYALASGE